MIHLLLIGQIAKCCKQKNRMLANSYDIRKRCSFALRFITWMLGWQLYCQPGSAVQLPPQRSSQV
jgi:hypothetical protein